MLGRGGMKGRLAKGESKQHCVGSARLSSQALNVSNIYFKKFLGANFIGFIHLNEELLRSL
jgi:hypothetical protein